MTSARELDYFTRRANEALRLAAQALHPNARRAHCTMAAAYGRRAELEDVGFAAVRPAHHEWDAGMPDRADFRRAVSLDRLPRIARRVDA